jgi:aminoglycoside phosphotransferase (APT) family kinase protein
MIRIGAGDKSEVFLLEDGRILKLFVPHFAYLAPDEEQIAHMLARAGVEAPRVEETREIDGRPALVFGNLPAGRTLSAAVRRAPWRIVSLARNLAVLHAAVHHCESGELPSQRERLAEEIRNSRPIAEAIRREALRVLAELPDGETVCHNDIHMLNVIVHSEGAMIIDWVLATRGNPLADVAAALLQLRFGERPRGLAGAALEAGRALFWRSYSSRYLGLRPGVREELARWELPIAVGLAGRREGRMKEQLVQRVNELTARNRSSGDAS